VDLHRQVRDPRVRLRETLLQQVDHLRHEILNRRSVGWGLGFRSAGSRSASPLWGEFTRSGKLLTSQNTLHLYATRLWRSLPGPWWLKVVLLIATQAIPGPSEPSRSDYPCRPNLPPARPAPARSDEPCRALGFPPRLPDPPGLAVPSHPLPSRLPEPLPYPPDERRSREQRDLIERAGADRAELDRRS
jgi:hypothetical protein